MARLTSKRGTAARPSLPASEDTADKPLDQPERGPGTPDGALPVRVRVNVDTLVSRTDLGPGVSTFVAAGDMIPLGLEGYPRVPA
ncbi:MAG: hypothetical protein M3401_17895 [Actinomycetota bacterium]|nr:hypothetical protein [Actinomycetota bacterium]